MSKSNVKQHRELKVLALGPMRSGTASMARALEVLGYQGVYHALKVMDSPEDWKMLSRAADATFPVLPTYSGKPFTREQWDELYGQYEAITDIGSLFAMELVEAYPEAKVVLVERDFDKWFKSVEDAILSQLWGRMADISINLISPIIGSEVGVATRKMVLGWFEAQDVDEIRRNARATYDRHYRELRGVVPPERLLEYRMGDGWEPLCEFLGRPVPDEDFPWVNETAAMKRMVQEKRRQHLREAGKKLLRWVGVGAVVLGTYWVVSTL